MGAFPTGWAKPGSGGPTQGRVEDTWLDGEKGPAQCRESHQHTDASWLHTRALSGEGREGREAPARRQAEPSCFFAGRSRGQEAGDLCPRMVEGPLGGCRWNNWLEGSDVRWTWRPDEPPWPSLSLST